MRTAALNLRIHEQEPQASPELLSLRNQIDSLDRSCWSWSTSARVAEQVGELKKKEGSAFFRPDRVAQVIEKIKSPTPAR
jgi:chorismate mutase/prephenate dehydratase